MAAKFLVCGAVLLFNIAHVSRAYPVLTQGVDPLEDSEIVGSSIREVRSVQLHDLEESPTNYHKAYDSGDDGDVGYSRKTNDKGKKGYQKFDSYHKKDGDSYAFEKHDSFGHDQKEGDDAHDGEGAYSQRVEHKKKKTTKKPQKSAAYSEGSDGDYDTAESSEEGDGGDYSEGDGGDYEGEESSGEASEEGSDGDYQSPSSYTYGAGDDYNFRK